MFFKTTLFSILLLLILQLRAQIAFATITDERSSIDELSTAELIHSVSSSNCSNPDEFQCNPGDICISKSALCDGKVDCLNKLDEQNCDYHKCLPPKWFQCHNDACIPAEYRCDGHYDCQDHDDEKSCDSFVKPPLELMECGDNEFACVKDNHCLGIDYVCDGTGDCKDNSDETEGCDKIKHLCKGFLCEDNKQCLSNTSLVCDGVKNCRDSSDEKSCDEKKCLLENKKYICKNKYCIDIHKVCDKIPDCLDKSDEGAQCLLFNNNTDCKSSACPIGTDCFITPTGPVCICPKGYKFNVDKRICEDIDECQLYGICSQVCTNTLGSYYCSCATKFQLQADGESCKSIFPNSMLFYAAKSSIFLYLLNDKHKITISSGSSQVIGVSYDGKYVYWTDVGSGQEKIRRAREDGSELQLILATGLSSPEDIAVDWLTKNIYFTDRFFAHIAVCANDGKYCTALINENLHQPRGISLYPQNGQMFWTDWGDHPMIATSWMDGTMPRILVNTNIGWPNGITLDWPNERLYWVDAKLNIIESVDLNGKNRKNVLDKVLRHPFGITIFENNIFWSDWDTKSIQTCNKFTCNDRKTILKDKRIFDVHVYNEALHPKLVNPCEIAPCSHICLLRPNSSYSCACPNEMTLLPDTRSCRNDKKPNYLLLGIDKKIIRFQHQNFGIHSVTDSRLINIEISKWVYNSLSGHMIIADNLAKVMYSLNLQTYETKPLLKNLFGSISALSFDYLGNNLYWSDEERNTIEVFSFNTGHRAIIYHFMGTDSPVALLVVPEHGDIWVAVRSKFGHTHIDRLKMHGLGEYYHIIEDNLGDGRFEFVYYKTFEYIYWLDSSKRKIAFTDYDAIMNHVHIFDLNHMPWSFAIIDENIYWSTESSPILKWKPMDSSVTHKSVPINVTTDPPYDLLLATIYPALKTYHICQEKAKNICSHICVPLSNITFGCVCPPGMIFKNEQINHTCIEQRDCDRRCDSGECYRSNRRCDGYHDCSDGSDEANCESINSQEISCKFDQFTCKNRKQCIDQEHQCDKHTDCQDGSDEQNCDHFDRTTRCHKNQFRCHSDGKCIGIKMLCDQENDCSDGSDELDCSHLDCKNFNMFQCGNNGRCISFKFICDGVLDCSDGSDEHNCSYNEGATSLNCPENKFKCANDDLCIDLEMVCNKQNDCGDNSDELNCKYPNKNIANDTEKVIECSENEFHCTSSKDKIMCLPAEVECNDVTDCPQGEDEVNCSGCRINEFQCHDTSKCIRLEFYCDNEYDCDDKSDEQNCTNYSNETLINEYHHFSYSRSCQNNMFDCKDGTCIEMSKVCDNKIDCVHNSLDEFKLCNSSCNDGVNKVCSHNCQKSPYGPICSCRNGYRLAGDQKTCIDINECRDYDPCSQKCDNTIGSFRCSCFDEYFLRLDKMTCKSDGKKESILFSSFDRIYNETDRMFTTLWQSNGTRILDMDSNIHKNYLYFTMEDSDAIFELNLLNQHISYMKTNNIPTKLAVDWITNNIYYISAELTPTLNICNMAEKICIELFKHQYRDVIKTIVLDSINNKLFYTVVHKVKVLLFETMIYSRSLDGTRSNVLVKDAKHITDITFDSNKKTIYYVEMDTQKIWSVEYDGKNQRQLIAESTILIRPISIALFEDHLYILNGQSREGGVCKVFDNHKCSRYQIRNDNPENLMIFHESRQIRLANVCESHKCNGICVQAERGPKCLCNNGIMVEPNVKCENITNNEVGMLTILKTDHVQAAAVTNVGLTLGLICGIVCIALLSMLIYLVYKKKVFHRKFSASIHFQNPYQNNNDDGSAGERVIVSSTSGQLNREMNDPFIKMTTSNISQKQQQPQQNQFRYNEIFLNEPSIDNMSDCMSTAESVDENDLDYGSDNMTKKLIKCNV